MLRRALFVPVALFLVPAAAGCHQLREEYTLNPDGSGKVELRRLAPMAMTMAGAPKELDPEAEARKAARTLVEKSRGVAAWKDVGWEVRPDGRILVTGTAYFPDLAKLELQESGRLRLTRPADGSMVVELDKSRKSKAPAAGAGEAPAKLSGKDLERAILAEKMKWQQGRGMMTAMLSGMEVTTVVHLPGEIGDLSCFARLEDGRSASFTLKGDEFLEALDELTATDDFWKKQAGGGRAALDEMEVPEVLEKLFGSARPPRLVVAKPGAALFDYAKELAAARAAEGKLREKLGAGTGAGSGSGTPAPAELAPAPEGAGLGRILVVEVQHRMKPDVPADKGLMVSSPCCQIGLVGEMPGAVVKVENGELEKAVAADGTDVLSKQRFWRKTNSARLAGKNKDLVQFSVTLSPLPAGTDSLKELAGSLVCTVGSGSKKVDLGEIELKSGATGAALGARVKSFNRNFRSFEIELALESPEEVRGFSFKTPDGAVADVSASGSSTWSKKSSFRFRFAKDVVEKLKVEVELYEKTEKRKLPFSVENLELR
jgi:hypothetical protein